jgi:flagellar biosynthesis GTPase FlhF
MFQTVLTDNDQVMLLRIMRHQVSTICNALEQSDYITVDRCWNLLGQLRIIEHEKIKKLMDSAVRPHIQRYATNRALALGHAAARHDFEEAERFIKILRDLNNHFPDENLVNLDELAATLQVDSAQHTAQQEAAEERRKAEQQQRRAEEIQQREAEERRRAEEELAREQRAREEMEARVRRQEAALDDERRRRPNIGVQVKIEVPCVIQ